MLFLNRQSARALGRATLAAGAAGWLAACGAPEAAPAPEPRLVRSLVVEGHAGPAVAEYTAEVRSRYETDLSFQVGGKIVSRAVDVGAVVESGQVLARLDDTDLRLHVQAARSVVAAAEAELDRAQSDEARHRDLLERGLTTRAAYLTQQTAVKTHQSRLEQAKADLLLAEQRLGYATLHADDDGVVTDIDAEIGTVVAAGQRVLRIARPSELEAVFDVPDSRIASIRGAANVELTTLDDASARYTARIREIAPSADEVTRTYQVRASIDHPPAKLRLGMTVTVRMRSEESGAVIALPATALFQQGSAPAVWVVEDDLTLVLRPVEIERYESEAVLVRAGLTDGERVVTAGVHRLAAQERVRLMTEERR
jgi:RND family efflux transporter MFP subunit